MQNIIPTEGIVLKSTQYKDDHSLITAYTREWGKVTLLAKGTHKIKSRMAWALDLGSLFRGKIHESSSGHRLLTGITLISNFEHLASYDTISHLFDVLKELDVLLTHEKKDTKIYEFLKRWLKELSQEMKPSLIEAGFFRLLGLLGYFTPNRNCEHCQKAFEPETKIYFHSEYNSFQGSCCAAPNQYIHELSFLTYKFIFLSYSQNERTLGQISVPGNLLKEAQGIRDIIKSNTQMY